MKQTAYHFIGIGGIGMSALATMLLQKGMKVSGSDQSSTKTTEMLRQKGAEIIIGHHSQNIRPSQIIIYSSAIRHDNPELLRAKELNCILWHRADLLRWLARNQHALVVVGSHGKTTTTALLAHVLYVAGKDPSYTFGGVSPSFITNGYLGFGPYFAIEGDESDGSMLKTDPFGAIITNIDNDHLDFWQTKQALSHAFVSFMLKVKNKEYLFWCKDDRFLNLIQPRGVSYGFSKQAEIRIENATLSRSRMKFDIATPSARYANIDLGIVGEHNVLNATAVFALALKLGIAESDIRLSFSSFKGVNRRLQKKGSYKDLEVYDDYAHHPTEIVATLKTLKAVAANKKIYAVFQPHRYSRMKALWNEFSSAFRDADEIIVTDIYSANEAPLEGIDSESFLREIAPQIAQKISYVERKKLENYLRSSLDPNSVVITLGAGDITHLSDALVE